MVRRSGRSSFMPRVWVFPGGVVDPEDEGPVAAAALTEAGKDLRPVVAAAMRELVEEVGIWLTTPNAPASLIASRPVGESVYRSARDAGLVFRAGDLHRFANWVTPTAMMKRFDTHFFAAEAPPDAVAAPDDSEVDHVRWLTPETAIEEGRKGDLLISPPTVRTLEVLREFPHMDEFIAHVAALGGHVPAQRPRIRLVDGAIEAVAPGDPGFDDLEDLPPDPNLMARAGEFVRPRVGDDAG